VSVDFQQLDDFGQDKQAMDELVHPWHVLRNQIALSSLAANIAV